MLKEDIAPLTQDETEQELQMVYMGLHNLCNCVVVFLFYPHSLSRHLLYEENIKIFSDFNISYPVKT